MKAIALKILAARLAAIHRLAHPRLDDQQSRTQSAELMRPHLRRANDRAGLCALALRHTQQRDQNHDCSQKKIDEERPAPRQVFDQPAAEQRPDRGGDSVNPNDVPMACPRRDSSNNALISDRCGSQKRSADALHRSRQDQLLNGRRIRRRLRRRRIRRHPAETCAAVRRGRHRPAHQDQCPQSQAVGFDHPLNGDHAGAETLLQRRQGNVDYRAVDESHARPRRWSPQYPDSLALAARRNCVSRTNDGLIARRFHKALDGDRLRRVQSKDEGGSAQG